MWTGLARQERARPCRYALFKSLRVGESSHLSIVGQHELACRRYGVRRLPARTLLPREALTQIKEEIVSVSPV